MKRGEAAVRKIQAAARRRRSGGLGGKLIADQMEAEAKALLKAPDELAVCSGEVVPAATDPNSIAEWQIKNTLEDPDSIAVGASEERIARLAELGILESAVDAAQSIGAENSLEKMLAHQLAGAHDASMRLLSRAFDPRNPPAETVRLANAAARLMQTFQEGLLALHRIRTGGRQVVLVQHVNVGEGGQAVIAGNIGRGAHKPGERGKRDA